jgi:diketogulonate reductase-like aldo/keto reductase
MSLLMVDDHAQRLPRISRRKTLVSFAAGLVATRFGLHPAAAEPDARLVKPIPQRGESIPVIGLGTWITFNVGDDAALRADRATVLAEFFRRGGGMIDSSPMYGSSERVIGDGLARLGFPAGLFAATKVWTPFAGRGRRQMEESLALWRIPRFDLMQVHNLVNWEGHLPTLFEMRAAGRIRYVGLTTSHGRRHDEMERLMTTQPIDFVQVSYNILDRDVERRLLPLAADRGLAVIANRPFRTGELFTLFGHRPLPPFAREFGWKTWAEFLLAFVVSHPAVTCAIPATSRVDHLAENMRVLALPLPDGAMRARMVRAVEAS